MVNLEESVGHRLIRGQVDIETLDYSEHRFIEAIDSSDIDTLRKLSIEVLVRCVHWRTKYRSLADDQTRHLSKIDTLASQQQQSIKSELKIVKAKLCQTKDERDYFQRESDRFIQENKQLQFIECENNRLGQMKNAEVRQIKEAQEHI
eukprot:GHVR01114319.1.p1 GENE.GHVR01114319.1~~GHVR01114319.1.p1  ORF type:complete len:148 (+),score=26.67 GHVR01114319.1:29-472(+)